MEYEWVIGRYTGERAKSVEVLANNGTGYLIIDTEGKGINRAIIVAFVRACDCPRSVHLQQVTDSRKLAAYEKMRNERIGITGRR